MYHWPQKYVRPICATEINNKTNVCYLHKRLYRRRGTRVQFLHYIPVSVAEAEIVEESTSEGNLRTEVRLHLQIAVSHLAFMIGWNAVLSFPGMGGEGVLGID